MGSVRKNVGTLFLLPGKRESQGARQYFHSGETVLQSGVYQVSHPEHEVPAEITLAFQDRFPPCSACEHAAAFLFLRPVEIDPDFRIRLFALPVIETSIPDKKEQAA